MGKERDQTPIDDNAPEGLEPENDDVASDGIPSNDLTGERTTIHTPKRPGFRIPSWTLGLLILVLTGVLVWAGDAYIRSRQRLATAGQEEDATVHPVETSTLKAPLPSSTPPPSATIRAPAPTPGLLPPTPVPAGEALILVAEFGIREGGGAPAADVAQDLYQALRARTDASNQTDLERAEWVRTERLSQVVTETTLDSTLRGSDATYVLWGLNDSQGTSAYLRRLGPPLLLPLSAQARQLALSEPLETELCALGSHDLAADFSLGVAAYQQGEHVHAAALLRSALDAADDQESDCESLLAHIYLYLGNLAALAGEYEAALTEYQAGLDLSGIVAADYALLHTSQASVYYAQEDPEAALAAANLALERDPDLANAYYHRANAYRALNQAEEARNDLDQAVARDPGHARAYASRGLVQHNAGALEDALGDYDRSLELDPWAAEVYLNRGGTYATLGDLDSALLDYSRALALQPDDADAYYNRGTVYAIQQRHPEALQDLNRALQIRPDFSQVFGNRGLLYKAMGETEAAIADLERFLELSDNAEWREMIEQHLAELKQAQE